MIPVAMELDLSTKTPAEQLRVIRVFRDMNQFAVAKVLGVDNSYVSLIENGYRVPDEKLRSKIEREFGIPASSWIAQPERVA